MPIQDRSFKRLTAENVARAPRKRGVYAIYEDRRLVFLGHALGRADTIRTQLRAHLRTAATKTRQYKREPNASPAARLKELLAEHIQAHGRLPDRNVRAS